MNDAPVLVTVWSIDLDSRLSPGSTTTDLLDDVERRAAAERRGRARHRYEAAHRFLREVLARHLGTEAEAVSYEHRCARCGGPHGRPRLVGGAPIEFSLSHSAAVALVAVGPVGALGVDVEQLRPRRYLDRLASRVLGPAELATFSRAAPDQRPRLFLEAWTRREAHLKSLGTGLGASLRDALPAPGSHTATWRDWPHGYVGSVVAEHDGPVEVTLREWVPTRHGPASGRAVVTVVAGASTGSEPT